MGPLDLLRLIPTSQFGNFLDLPGKDLPFLPARFIANMAKQIISPDHPEVPLPLRLMANTPPSKIMGKGADLLGMPKTGYPAPIRAVQGALSLVNTLSSSSKGRSKNPYIDFLR